MNACNIQLTSGLMVIEQVVDKLELKVSWAVSLVLLAESRPTKRDPKRRKLVRTLDRLPDALDEAVRSQAAKTWAELRSIEIVLGEVAEEFGGEGPLRPCNGESLRSSKERLQALQELTTGFELPEPGEEELDVLRRAITNWARLSS